jgi:uncharacterized protein
VFRVVVALVLRIIAFVATLWFIKRLFQSGRTAQTRGRASQGEASTGKMVKDPVCGMYMDARLAIRVDQKGDALFFCSDDCRRKFLESRVD